MLGLASIAPQPQPSGLVPPPPAIDCSERVEGPPGWPPRGWQRDAVRIGPIAFVGLRSGAQGPPSAETVALVRAGTQVTIHSPDAPLLWPGAEGKSAVTFLGCDRRQRLWSRHGRVGRYTQFNGGFRLSEPGCARIDVWVNQRRRPLRRYLSFGGSCPPERPGEPPPSDLPTGLVPPPPVLGCTSRVETGRGFPPRGWRRTSVGVGPLTLYSLRANLRRNRSAETVAIVRAGRQATLSIPPPNRRALDLLFGPTTDSVTFKACPRSTRRFSGDHRRIGRYTLFQGGVSSSERRCAPLDFWTQGKRHPTRRYVGFGRPC
jgi:hypothetical protein